MARPGTGAGGLSMTQRTCVGGKITFVDPQFGDGLDAVGDSDGYLGRCGQKEGAAMTHVATPDMETGAPWQWPY